MAAAAGLTEEQLKKFRSDGLLAIEGFLTEKEADGLRAACLRELKASDPRKHRGTFSTTSHAQARDRYFLDSATRVHYFYEEGSLDESTGEFGRPREECAHKVGHTMHVDIQEFKEVTFGAKVKSVAKSLGLQDPMVVQGMYIFKLPGGMGGPCTPHQDGSFLINEPTGGTLVGCWFALDDATVENGCLWYSPGSHKNDIGRHMVRNPNWSYALDDNGSEPMLTFEGEDPKVAEGEWVAAPVKKGSLVLIDGRVMHKSETNRSPHPRHAYTFHMVETKGCTWSPRGWLQPTEEFPVFPRLYDDKWTVETEEEE